MRDLHKDSRERLLQIEKAIIDIQKFVQKETEDSFYNTQLIQDAVSMQFIVIGEAILYVEEEKLFPYEYPWYKVKSFRNMIAHEYFNIKMSAVWGIIKKDLPELKKVVPLILKSEF